MGSQHKENIHEAQCPDTSAVADFSNPWRTGNPFPLWPHSISLAVFLRAVGGGIRHFGNRDVAEKSLTIARLSQKKVGQPYRSPAFFHLREIRIASDLMPAKRAKYANRECSKSASDREEDLVAFVAVADLQAECSGFVQAILKAPAHAETPVLR